MSPVDGSSTGTTSSRTRTASSVTTQRQTSGPRKVPCRTSCLTTAPCRWSAFPTDPTHRDLPSNQPLGGMLCLHARRLPFAMIHWPLVTQMGNHFNLTAFRHAAQSLPQLSGMLGRADVHLSQRRAQLTASGVTSEAPGNCGTQLRPREMTRGRKYLHNKQLFRHIRNPKSSFRRWPHSFDGD